jgi:hypothetical protein
MKLSEICNTIEKVLFNMHHFSFKSGEDIKRYLKACGKNIFMLSDFCYDEKRHKLIYEFMVESDDSISYERFEV